MAVTRRRLSTTHAALEHERALAVDALRLGRLLRDSSLWPSRWTEPAFGAEVERCRRHVADLTTQDALASAYAYDVFERLWADIRGCLRRGGIFAGQLFGPHDDFAAWPQVNTHERADVERLLDGLTVVRLDEEDKDGTSFAGPKHWHVFHIIARA